MPLCKSYADLSYKEQVLLIGQIQIAIQYNEQCFEIGNDLVKMAHALGVFSTATTDIPSTEETNSINT